LALLGWQWLETRQRLSDVQSELASRLADSDAVAKESRVVARNTQESQAVLQAKVAQLDAQLAEAQGQQSTFDALYRDLAKSSDERLLAEVEQTVTLAAQQLRLAGNVETALIALSGIEARLARASRPQFATLRKLIVRDIERLKAQPGVDVPALSTKLDAIIASVDTLPLAYERRPKAEAAKPEQGTSAGEGYARSLAQDFWNELRQLVRVERIDTPGHADPGLLSPSQSFFLRENLKLRLVNARLSLLTRDGRSFREDVRQSTAWLEHFFDGSAKAVQADIATLRVLQATDPGAELPGLNETLDAVRNFKLAGQKK
jgi:uroporphyrin-3 C-methyltransferase